MLFYYITDRTQFFGDEDSRQRALLDKIAEAARCGIDYIQLREKDLSAHQLEALANAALHVIHENSTSTTRLLINSRTDVALACHADGVHLRSDDISPSEVRTVWKFAAGVRPQESALISVSCHSVSDVSRAASEGADFALFAPVFGKSEATITPAGVDGLSAACKHKIPVLALGGITLANGEACIDAGAVGVAGIRLFQGNQIADVVRKLRA